VQTAETFKVIREILTCWLLFKKIYSHVKPLLLLQQCSSTGVPQYM